MAAILSLQGPGESRPQHLCYLTATSCSQLGLETGSCYYAAQDGLELAIPCLSSAEIIGVHQPPQMVQKSFLYMGSSGDPETQI